LKSSNIEMAMFPVVITANVAWPLLGHDMLPNVTVPWFSPTLEVQHSPICGAFEKVVEEVTGESHEQSVTCPSPDME